MTATPCGLALLCIIVLFLLHALWRLGASRDGAALACFAAAYLILATLLHQHAEPVLIAPLMLPFVYVYAWLSLAAAMWIAARARPSRNTLSFPGCEPKLAALFASQLALLIGVLAVSPWLGQAPLAVYLMAPPLTMAVSYLCYRLQLLEMRRGDVCGTRWLYWGALCLLGPLLLACLKVWAVPMLLDLT
ncbi:hypothetical protein [Chromobacterium paludis]|uniref:Uncharacterized protein n=1 Tax=Chromobacterium paludis TaxID=2605945 RepID=A0A5C1DEV1_9NEIS|nr:hypothetical protein [Chromobacterium paludis]QEL55314.1 hypothetical protein FYK34_06905 [Chromobacterium paludis]